MAYTTLDVLVEAEDRLLECLFLECPELARNEEALNTLRDLLEAVNDRSFRDGVDHAGR